MKIMTKLNKSNILFYDHIFVLAFFILWNCYTHQWSSLFYNTSTRQKQHHPQECNISDTSGAQVWQKQLECDKSVTQATRVPGISNVSATQQHKSNTSAIRAPKEQRKWDQSNTSDKSATQLQQESNTSDTSATQVLHEQHKCDSSEKYLFW